MALALVEATNPHIYLFLLKKRVFFTIMECYTTHNQFTTPVLSHVS